METPPPLMLPLLTLILRLPLCRLKLGPGIALPGAGIPLPGVGIPLTGSGGGMPLMLVPRSYLVEKVPRLLGVRYTGSKSSPRKSIPLLLPLILPECPRPEELKEDAGQPTGVRTPEMELRDVGRCGAATPLRDTGLVYDARLDEWLDRETGRLTSEPLSLSWVLKESRFTPDVLILGVWLVLDGEA